MCAKELEDDSKDSQPDLSAQLSNAITLSAKQDQIVWAIFGIFWAANAVLLVALFTTGKEPERPVGLTVSAVGVVISLVWSLVQWRAVSFMNFYDVVIDRLERRLLGSHTDVALSTRINNISVTGPRGRPIIIGSSIFSLLAWLGAVCHFLCSRCAD